MFEETVDNGTEIVNDTPAATTPQSQDQGGDSPIETVDNPAQTPQYVKVGDKQYTMEQWKEMEDAYTNKQKWIKEQTQKAQHFSEQEKKLKPYADFASWWEKSTASEKREWLAKNIKDEPVNADPVQQKISAFEQRVNQIENTFKKKEDEAYFSNVASQYNASKDKHKEVWTDFDEANIAQIFVATGKPISEIADKYFEGLAARDSKLKASYIDKKNAEKTKGHMPPGGGAPASSEKKLSDDDRKKSFVKDFFGA